MLNKRFLMAWLATAVVLFILNGLFHGLLMAGFFDRQMAGLGPAVIPMKDFNPLPIVLLELTADFAIAWLITRDGARVDIQRAMTTGALVYLVASGSWNLANRATLVSWPATLMVVDISWHVVTGVLAGAIVAGIWNRRRSASTV